jgi:hypothetical protein
MAIRFDPVNNVIDTKLLSSLARQAFGWHLDGIRMAFLLQKRQQSHQHCHLVDDLVQPSWILSFFRC